MKTWCLKISRNMSRMSFNLRGAENSDEHILVSSMHMYASCMLWPCVCI